MGATTPGDIVATAQGAGEFSTLVSAIQAAGLVETLKGPGPYTVFAPTDAAFKALPAGTLDQLMQPANKGRLVSVLTYHVVPGKLTAADLRPGQSLTTVQGGKLTVTAASAATDASGSTKAGGSKTKGASTTSGAATTAAAETVKVKVNGATIVAADKEASNGIVHAIDKVLLPSAKAS